MGVTRVKTSLQIDRKYPASEVFLGLTSLGILAHLLRMVMESKYFAEEVIGHPNHPLTR